MSLVKKVTVKSASSAGPFTGQFGDFHAHKIIGWTDDGSEQEFTKFDKSSILNPSIVPGVELSIIFQQVNGKKGMMNKVTELLLDGEQSKASNPLVGQNTVPAINPGKAKECVDETLSSRTLSIARMNAVTSAVALCKTESDLDLILDVAEQIVRYTTEPYTNKELLK